MTLEDLVWDRMIPSNSTIHPSLQLNFLGGLSSLYFISFGVVEKDDFPTGTDWIGTAAKRR